MGLERLTCEICRLGRPAHREAEAAGEVNHEFSEDGRLVQIKRTETKETPPAGAPMPPSDPVLRMLLLEKGLITLEELDEATTKLRVTGFLSQR